MFTKLSGLSLASSSLPGVLGGVIPPVVEDPNSLQAIPATHWAATGPTNDGFDIVLFKDIETEAGKTAPTDVLFSINGAAPVSMGQATAGKITITGLERGKGYSITAWADNGSVGDKTRKSYATLMDADTRGFRGFKHRPASPVMTAGDLLVAPYGNDDTNGGDGSTANPFLTISRARLFQSAGQKIFVRAGRYEEIVTINDEVDIVGFETETPSISGFKALDTFQQCDASDAAIIGSEGRANSPVYKLNVPNNIASHGESLGLSFFEASERLYQTTAREDTTDLFRVDDKFTYYSAPSAFGLTGGQVTSITDPAIITNPPYTQSVLLAAATTYICDPNLFQQAQATAVDFSTGTITVPAEKIPNGTDALYAFTNIPVLDTAGTFYIHDEGDGTSTVYIRPRDPANVDLIDVLTKDHVIRMSGAPDDVGLYNIILDGVSSSNGLGGAVWGTSGQVYQNFKMEGVLIRGMSWFGSNPGACIKISHAQNATFKHLTFEDAMSCDGFQINTGSDTLIDRCNAERISGTHVYAQGQLRMVVAHCKVNGSTFRIHKNALTAYSETDKFLLLACELALDPNSESYITIQRCSNFTMVGCEVHCTGSVRTFADQSNDQGEPDPGAPLRMINNHFRFPEVDTAAPAVLAVQTVNSQATSTLYAVNNVMFGASTPSSLSVTPQAFESNLITRLDLVGTNQTAASFPDDVVELDLSTIYAADGSFLASGPVGTMMGVDVTAEIAQLKLEYPHLPAARFDVSYLGTPIDWSKSLIGPDPAHEQDRVSTATNTIASIGEFDDASQWLVAAGVTVAGSEMAFDNDGTTFREIELTAAAFPDVSAHVGETCDMVVNMSGVTTNGRIRVFAQSYDSGGTAIESSVVLIFDTTADGGFIPANGSGTRLAAYTIPTGASNLKIRVQSIGGTNEFAIASIELNAT